MAPDAVVILSEAAGAAVAAPLGGVAEEVAGGAIVLGGVEGA
jgi:hypothetical protein